MSKVFGRSDRTARLLKLQILLWQYPDGIKINEIARLLSVSNKTIYRDINALEYELKIPIWEEGSKRGIAEGYFLPPIHFTLPEAVNIFLAARLMQCLSPVFNPNIASTFMKLDIIVPPLLRKYIKNIIENMEKQPRDERSVTNFNKLAQAWLSQRQVKICYQELSGEEPNERIIDPYFIEPLVFGSASYIIAYCHLKKKICSFKIDQIVSDVIIEPDTFEIPSNFNPIDYIDSVFGVYDDQDLVKVKLHFIEKVSKVIRRTHWHNSQTLEECKDGSIIMTLKVRNTIFLRSWILGFADHVKVLEPKKLRNQIINSAKSLLEVYDYKNQP